MQELQAILAQSCTKPGLAGFNPRHLRLLDE